MDTSRATAGFSPNDKSTFQVMLTQYERKQNVEALKSADKVLVNHPDHAESISFKALILNQMNKFKEAMALIQDALANNVANYTVWHVFGILNKGVKNLQEAKKAYINALKYDDQNMNVLRDLSILQNQLGEYKEFAETRRQIAVLKPHLSYLVVYCVAVYLTDDFKLCNSIMDAIFDMIKTTPQDFMRPNEICELYLFRTTILEKFEGAKKALKFLTKQRKWVVDETRYLETVTRLYFANNQKAKGLDSVNQLIAINPDKSQYYLQVVTDAKAGDEISILKEYDNQTAKRVIIKLIKAGSEFKERLIQYIKPQVIKGTPSVVNELADIYEDEDKAKIFGEILQDMSDSMELGSSLSPEDQDEQQPIVQVWLFAFLSQHNMRIGNVEKAFEYINKAIAQSPETVELYTIKAKIYQFGGNRVQASALIETARGMDKHDRCLNALDAKYQFKIDNIEKAQDIMRLFSSDKDTKQLNVHQMQTLWYEKHQGNAYLRKGDYRMALKNFQYTEKHFETMLEDCYEFAQYSFRRGTVNHYFQMLDFQKNIWIGDKPVSACIGILRTISKIRKAAAVEGGLKKIKKDKQEYIDSIEYEKWQEKYANRDADDHYVNNDPDPEGWAQYLSAAQGKESCSSNFVANVSRWNQTEGALQAKCMNFFISINKPDEALQAAKYLVANSLNHPKAARALKNFQEYAKKETLKEEFTFDVPTQQASTMLHAHEMRDGKSAISALDTDTTTKQVYVAVNTHQRLVKLNDTNAKEYFTKCQEKYSYSTYFEGKNAEKK